MQTKICDKVSQHNIFLPQWKKKRKKTQKQAFEGFQLCYIKNKESSPKLILHLNNNITISYLYIQKYL